MNGNIEINLREFFRTLLKRAWIIVLCAVICGAAVFVYAKKVIKPTYQSSISVYVNNNAGRENPYISSSDLAVALRLVATYVNIIQSDRVLDKVIDEANVNLTTSQLRSMISAKAIGETEMFRVTVTHTNKKTAKILAEAIATVAPSEINGIIEGSTAKIIDHAREAQSPVNPGYTTKVILGALAGAAIVILITLLQILMDVRINSEEDLAKISSIPVLGVIPALSVEHKKHRRKRKEGGKRNAEK